MTKLLLKSGIVVTQDAKLGVLPKGDVLVEGGRIAAIAPVAAGRCRDDRLQRPLRAAGPGQRPHAHLADGAALGRRQLDAAGVFPPRPCRPRHGVHARGHPCRHAGRRAEPARPWRHHAGRLVPQQPDARAHRCRHRRPEGVGHPRRLLPRIAQARSQARRAALLRGPSSAPGSRAAAEGAAVRPQCAGDAGHGGARPALLDARGQRPRLRAGQGARPGRLHAPGRRRGQDAGRLGSPDAARPGRPAHQHRARQQPHRRAAESLRRSRRQLLGHAGERDGARPRPSHHRPAARAGLAARRSASTSNRR